MKRFLRPVLIGITSFLLGMGSLYLYMKSGTDAPAREYHSSGKPIVPALQLPAPKPDDDQALAPAPAQPGAKPPRGIPPIFDKDDEEFMNQPNPFAVMKKMQQQMEKEMDEAFAQGNGGTFEAGGEEITAKEDDKSLSYEIRNVEGSSLNTSVKNGYLTIRGETKKQSAGMTFQSSFQRSFSLPPNVDATKMETISEKDKVVLRFPKKSS